MCIYTSLQTMMLKGTYSFPYLNLQIHKMGNFELLHE